METEAAFSSMTLLKACLQTTEMVFEAKSVEAVTKSETSSLTSPLSQETVSLMS